MYKGQRRGTSTVVKNEQKKEKKNNICEWIKGRKKEQQQLLVRIIKGQKRKVWKVIENE
jgi:hypothetical protein